MKRIKVIRVYCKNQERSTLELHILKKPWLFLELQDIFIWGIYENKSAWWRQRSRFGGMSFRPVIAGPRENCSGHIMEMKGGGRRCSHARVIYTGMQYICYDITETRHLHLFRNSYTHVDCAHAGWQSGLFVPSKILDCGYCNPKSVVRL